jgi:hypothetical protein
MSKAILVIPEACVSTLKNWAVEDLALLRHGGGACARLLVRVRACASFIAHAFVQSLN